MYCVPEIEAKIQSEEKRKRPSTTQQRASYLRWFVCEIQTSGSTRRVGSMAQSAQVNYSLSWEETQTEEITSAQIVKHRFRVSWRARYVSRGGRGVEPGYVAVGGGGVLAQSFSLTIYNRRA